MDYIQMLMLKIMLKLKRLKLKLKSWNWDVFGDVNRKVDLAPKCLGQIQLEI